MKLTIIEESIISALFDLMQINEYDKISITDLTEKAGVSRVSYYRHFTSKKDVIIRFFDEIKEKLLDTIYSVELTGEEKWNYCIDYVFSLIKDNKLRFQILKNNNLDYLFLTYITDAGESFYSDEENKYSIHLLAGAFFNTCMYWLRDNCSDSVEAVAKPFYCLESIFQFN